MSYTVTIDNYNYYTRVLLTKKWFYGILQLKSNGYIYRENRKWLNAAKGGSKILYGKEIKLFKDYLPPHIKNDELLIYIPTNEASKRNSLWVLCKDVEQFE